MRHRLDVMVADVVVVVVVPSSCHIYYWCLSWSVSEQILLTVAFCFV